MKNNNKKAFSLFIAIFLVLITSLLSIYLLEYIIPFARNNKWIENWTRAYYEANKWIEQTLYFIRNRPTITSETWSSMPANAIWYSINLISSWATIPKPWEWNSEYDKDYNMLSQNEPIQLWIWRKETWNADLDWSNDWIWFKFKVPNITTWLSLSWANYPIINWVVTSENEALIASWSYITTNQINSEAFIQFLYNTWSLLDWTPSNLQIFHDLYCNGSNSGCILKMSLINRLVLVNWNTIPYIEYKLIRWSPWTNANAANYILPDRYSKINTSWKSYWFQKNLEVKVPQKTVNQAFDFTVFQ